MEKRYHCVLKGPFEHYTGAGVRGPARGLHLLSFFTLKLMVVALDVPNLLVWVTLIRMVYFSAVPLNWYRSSPWSLIRFRVVHLLFPLRNAAAEEEKEETSFKKQASPRFASLPKPRKNHCSKGTNAC